MAKIRVGIIYGGRSVEHEVSIASATSILQALDPARYDVQLIAISKQGHWHLGGPDLLPEAVLEEEEVTLPAIPGQRTLVSVERGTTAAELDVVLPIVHGTGGEDGTLQGFLELAGVPYVGAGVLGSAVAMDKDVAKRLLAAAGLPVVPGVCIRTSEIARGQDGASRALIAELGLPLFVKPVNLGSSVGISKVERAAQLGPALEEAARFDDKILIELGVDAREVEVAVLGNDEPEASVPGEIVPHADFYDYESKYVDEATELRVPAPLSDAQTARLQELAIEAFRVLEGRGMARVDFFIDKQTEEVWLNEVNTLPGFTDVSMVPRLWQASGLPYPALLDRLIELALEHSRRRQNLERSYQRG
ncbi:MAG: D-alanine--D-alanine ligase [bacterium]|nr:D-alanine--D-alanine ligase [bacterium]MCP5068763.1 D-alanine--D-alanine ligase [bacterium]